MFQTHKTLIKDYLFIIFGVFLMAFAIVCFWQPHSLVTGGVSGLSIIIEDYSSRMGYAVPLWVTNLVLNTPLVLLGFKTMGKKFIVRTAFATVLMSLAMYVMTYVPAMAEDVLLGALFGGVICGLGVGLIVRSMASTGGTTLAAIILHNSLIKHVSVGKLLFGCDFVIILLGLLAFGPESAMYAVVGVFVSTKVTDAILEGFSFARAAYIISDKSNAIAEAVMKQLNRGATEISARGMYTKEARPMLMCIVSGRELVHLKQVVYEQDVNAFIIVADVREVLGAGFTSHSI
jgi:uncharacterized membrane-anchored protein YitT (DUF2179 family)